MLDSKFDIKVKIMSDF